MTGTARPGQDEEQRYVTEEQATGDPGTGMAVSGLADVPRSRHYVSDRLRAEGNEDLLDLAALAVTELVTNALLHGRPPVEVRVTQEPGVASLEVVDGSPVLPVLGHSGEEEMTGRGLALLTALASRWGARPVPGGKVVWAELRAGADADAALAASLDPALFAGGWDDLDAFDDADAFEDLGDLDALATGPITDASADLPVTALGQAAPVRLPDVPVDLLLAVESHVDDLVRDLTLAGNTRSPWRDDAVPAAVAARVSSAADAVGPIRRSLRRQALDGRGRGADTVAVTVPSGPDVVGSMGEYLAALDEADSYCRAARLLTLEAPPPHRVFRRWVADQVVLATEAARLGGPPHQVQPFRERLLDELATLAVVQRTAARAGRLQRVATGLSEARTPEQVAGVVLEQGTAALGAARAAFLRLEDGRLSLIGALGMGEAALQRAAVVTVDDVLPSTDALRQGQPVWVESLGERERRYPELSQADPASRALVAAPLVVDGRTLGVLRFGFDADLVVDDDERDFVAAIAAQAATALDRSLTYAAEHRAREQAERTAGRLRRLQQITALLSGSLEESEVASLVLGHAAEALGAGIATLSLLARPAAPALIAPDAEVVVAHLVGVTDEARRRWTRFSMADAVPVPDAIRSNAPVVLPTVGELHARYPAMTGPGMPGEEHALVVMPLSVGDRRLGALTLSFFGRPAVPGPDDLAFLGSLADVCAQALDRVAAVRSLRAASSRLAFLAEASVELASSPDVDHTLLRVAELSVPLVADWCAVAVQDDDGLRTVALASADPASGGARRSTRVDPPEGRGAAARRALATGQPEIAGRLDDGSVPDELPGVCSVMTVPVVARGRALGVLTFISSSPERAFDSDDLSLAEELARRAGLALVTAQLLSGRTGPVDSDA